MSPLIKHFYRFGAFTLDTDQRVLLREGKRVSLTPKVFDTLLILVENNERIVEKEELMNRLWPDTFVEEDNLTFNVKQLRKSLGDDARRPVYIETIPRRGYRFIANVEEVLSDRAEISGQSGGRFDTAKPQAALAHQQLESDASVPPSQSEPADTHVVPINTNADSTPVAASGSAVSRSDGIAARSETPPTMPGRHFSTEGEKRARGQIAPQQAGERSVAQTARDFLSRGPTSRVTVLVVAALVIALAAFLYFLILKKSNQTAGPGIKSLAVLPFKSFGADEGDEYLGIGIAETLTTRLSGLKLVAMRPNSAVLNYAASGQDTVATGRALSVESVLEGSIRRVAERVRVTVRLVSVKEGSLLWADTFDENFTDIFKVEDSISEKVVDALALELSGEEKKRLTKRHTENAEAYQLYAKGRYFWNKRTEDGFKRGIAHFEQAVEKDPGYSLAYAGLADSYIGLTFYNFVPPHEAMPNARQAAIKALEIDQTLAEAHASLAHVKVNYDWDWSAAEKEFKRSIELNPEYATAHQWYATHYLTAIGQRDQAVAEMRRAEELEPTSLVMNTFLGAALYFAGHYVQAIDQCQRTLEMDRNFAVAHWHLGLIYEQKAMFDEAIVEHQAAITLSGGSPLMKAALGHAYAKAGRSGKAIKVLEELRETSKRRYVSSYEMAAICVALGDKEQAFQLLEKSFSERAFHLVYLNVWPQFEALHPDPRFQDLGRRIGLTR